MLVYVDESGNANSQYVSQVPPSGLATYLKTVIQLIGTDVIEQLYIESVRGSIAKYGLEMKNPGCTIDGLSTGETLEITVTWDIPGFAKFKDNIWTITYDWVDNESAAKETIAMEDSSWMQVRVVASLYNVQIGFYKRSYITALILPENAQNIQSSLIGTTYTTDYGGGSYSETSLHVGEIDGRPAVIENGLSVVNTENEITLTVDQLLENSLVYIVNYDGVSPENSSFIGTLDRIRLDSKYGREFDDNYSIYSGGEWHSLSPAQALYYAADAVVIIDQGSQFSIQQPVKYAAPPDSENGEWRACWENLTKGEYVSLAQTVRDNINSTGAAPSTLETSIGKIRYRDVLYTFTRVLHSYEETGVLPSEIMFAPVPSGELVWEETQLGADNAYYLLPDTYVITGTTRVDEVLDNVRDNHDNRELAEEICNWTGSNIKYSLSYVPPTSEEVLVSKTGQCRDYTNVYLALSRTAGIPARRVSGWIVSAWQPPTGWEFIVGTTPEGKTVASHAWSQAYLPGEGWVPLEPESFRPQLYVGTLPYEVYRQVEQTWTNALAGYETARGVL